MFFATSPTHVLTSLYECFASRSQRWCGQDFVPNSYSATGNLTEVGSVAPLWGTLIHGSLLAIFHVGLFHNFTNLAADLGPVLALLISTAWEQRVGFYNTGSRRMIHPHFCFQVQRGEERLQPVPALAWDDQRNCQDGGNLVQQSQKQKNKKNNFRQKRKKMKSVLFVFLTKADISETRLAVEQIARTK